MNEPENCHSVDHYPIVSSHKIHWQVQWRNEWRKCGNYNDLFKCYLKWAKFKFCPWILLLSGMIGRAQEETSMSNSLMSDFQCYLEWAKCTLLCSRENSLKLENKWKSCRVFPDILSDFWVNLLKEGGRLIFILKCRTWDIW
jgi:hypothetical protein